LSYGFDSVGWKAAQEIWLLKKHYHLSSVVLFGGEGESGITNEPRSTQKMVIKMTFV